ncbi:DNA-directed RNA polymerase I subunit [Martiniozyma asiatica (nom. inval.)]|nr:DNA-directed RNA polymerase I subunit [Martiniozyma asiatica]
MVFNLMPHVEEPVLVSTFTNSTTTPNRFTAYDQTKSSSSSKGTILQSTTQELIYQAHQDLTNDYLLAVVDKNSQIMDLIPSKFLSGSTKVKNVIESDVQLETKVKKALHVIRDSQQQFNEKRSELGGLFGSKKAKKAILDAQKNKIDSTNVLNDEQMAISEQIGEAAKLIPTLEAINEEAEFNARFLPKGDESATNPNDIYPINDIIYKKTYSMIRTTGLYLYNDENNKSTIESRMSALPFIPETAKNLFNKLLNEESIINDEDSLKILSFISTIWALYDVRARKLSDLEKSFQKNSQPSPALLKSILKLFTANYAKSGNSNFYTLDEKHRDKILIYIIILLLKLNNYLLELEPLSAALKLRPVKITALVRSIGCQVRVASISEAKELGVEGKKLKNWKVAELKVPFKKVELAKRRGGSGR